MNSLRLVLACLLLATLVLAQDDNSTLGTIVAGHTTGANQNTVSAQCNDVVGLCNSLIHVCEPQSVRFCGCVNGNPVIECQGGAAAMGASFVLVCLLGALTMYM